jgi:hypothetical protein
MIRVGRSTGAPSLDKNSEHNSREISGRSTRVLRTLVLPLETYSFADSRPLRFVRFHRQPSGTASTILAGPTGAFGFTGELTTDLFEA